MNASASLGLAYWHPQGRYDWHGRQRTLPANRIASHRGRLARTGGGYPNIITDLLLLTSVHPFQPLPPDETEGAPMSESEGRRRLPESRP